MKKNTFRLKKSRQSRGGKLKKKQGISYQWGSSVVRVPESSENTSGAVDVVKKVKKKKNRGVRKWRGSLYMGSTNRKMNDIGNGALR